MAGFFDTDAPDGLAAELAIAETEDENEHAAFTWAFGGSTQACLE